jgi:hypothetical protein
MLLGGGGSRYPSHASLGNSPAVVVAKAEAMQTVTIFGGKRGGVSLDVAYLLELIPRHQSGICRLTPGTFARMDLSFLEMVRLWAGRCCWNTDISMAPYREGRVPRYLYLREHTIFVGKGRKNQPAELIKRMVAANRQVVLFG